MAGVGLLSGTTGGGTSAQLRWLVADQLGTPRMVCDKTGSLGSVKRHDYLPFGEELFAGVGGRTTALGYTADAMRQKFTSYERDNETGLDYAQARYCSPIQGRFTSADPLMASAQATDPQSLNRYAYVGNNPMVFADPSGMSRGPAGLYSSMHDADRPPASRGNNTLLDEAQAEWEVRLPDTRAAIAEADSINEALRQGKITAEEARNRAAKNPMLKAEETASPIRFTTVELLKFNESDSPVQRSSKFSEPVVGMFNADLNVEDDTQVFDSKNPAVFTIRVNFKVDPHPDIESVGEGAGTQVMLPERSQFRHPKQSESGVPGARQWYTWKSGGDRTGGYMDIRLKYSGKINYSNRITVTVGGSFGSRDHFSSRATIRLTRNP